MSYEDVAKQVIHAYYRVYNTLGHGFLENVYKNALKIEFAKMNLEVAEQTPIEVYYEKEIVGEYTVDFLIGNQVLVLVRAEDALRKEDEAKLNHCLKGTIIEAGVLLNFGFKAQFKRKVFQNQIKRGTLKSDRT